MDIFPATGTCYGRFPWRRCFSSSSRLSATCCFDCVAACSCLWRCCWFLVRWDHLRGQCGRRIRYGGGRVSLGAAVGSRSVALSAWGFLVSLGTDGANRQRACLCLSCIFSPAVFF